MFSVAGKTYLNPVALKHRKVGQFKSKWIIEWEYPVYEDAYGRRVIQLYERYPCFDSSDYLYEDRYFNWYLISWEEGVALVYVDDGSGEVLTEDHFTEELYRKYRFSDEYRQCLRDCGFIE